MTIELTMMIMMPITAMISMSVSARAPYDGRLFPTGNVIPLLLI